MTAGIAVAAWECRNDRFPTLDWRDADVFSVLFRVFILFFYRVQ
jgi:hypothetical protein